MNKIDKRTHDWWAPDFKEGPAAAACRYWFKYLPAASNEDGGRRHFALCVLVHSLAQLGSNAAPRLRWFAPAAPWEKADFGSDDWDGQGLMFPDAGDVLIRDDAPSAELPRVVAHEACHAVRHRAKAPSVETEREAIAFARRVAAVFAIDAAPMADLFVRESWKHLPNRAFTDSRAICLDDWGVYLNMGSFQFPRWRRYRELARAAPGA